MSETKRPKWKHYEDVFAECTILNNLNGHVRYEAVRAIESGYLNFFVKADLMSKIRVGKAFLKLKKLLGLDATKKIIQQYWLYEKQDYSGVERLLQQASQIYRFSIRKGKKLNTDMPIDSYLRIMKYVESLGTKRGKNHAIEEVNQSGVFKNASVSNIHDIRKAVELAKKNIKNSPLNGLWDASENNLKTLKRTIRMFWGHVDTKYTSFTKDVPKDKKNIMDNKVKEMIGEIIKDCSFIENVLKDYRSFLEQVIKLGYIVGPEYKKAFYEISQKFGFEQYD